MPTITKSDPVPTPEQIREARLNAGLTQTELGNMLHTYWGTVSRWERGKTIPEGYNRYALTEFVRENGG